MLSTLLMLLTSKWTIATVVAVTLAWGIAYFRRRAQRNREEQEEMAKLAMARRPKSPREKLSGRMFSKTEEEEEQRLMEQRISQEIHDQTVEDSEAERSSSAESAPLGSLSPFSEHPFYSGIEHVPHRQLSMPTLGLVNEHLGDSEKMQILRLLTTVSFFHLVDERVLVSMAKRMEWRTYRKGKLLFGRAGARYKENNSLFVVKSGSVRMYVDSVVSGKGDEVKRKQETLAIRNDRECVTSMLCLVAALVSDKDDFFLYTHMNRNQRGQSDGEEHDMTEEEKAEAEVITAVTDEETILAVLPFHELREIYKKHTRAMLRLVRTVALRLQHVTLQTIHRYFGLLQELLLEHKYEREIPRWPVEVMERHDTQAQVLYAEEAEETPENQFSRSLGELHNEAFCGLVSYLQLGQEDVEGMRCLRNAIKVQQYEPGEVLMEPSSLDSDRSEDQVYQPALFYIIKGKVSLSLSSLKVAPGREEEGNFDDGEEVTPVMHTATSGNAVGHFASLTGSFSYIVTAEEYESESASDDQMTIVGRVSREDFNALLRVCPKAASGLMQALLFQVSPFLRQIDFALEWQHVTAGQILFDQSQPSDSMYIVLSGRLRATKRTATRNTVFPTFGFFKSSVYQNQKTVDEFGRGDSFGAIEVLCDTPRTAQVTAIRDTELVRISSWMFRFIVQRCPHVVVRFSRFIGSSMVRQLEATTDSDVSDIAGNFTTVAVLGVTPNVNVAVFCRRLSVELRRIVTTIHLDSNAAFRFSSSSAGLSGDVALVRWLAQMEEKYKIILYQCDEILTPWTQRCIRQADCILAVADSDADPTISRMEDYLLDRAAGSRKELVLLHKNLSKSPSGTVNWLSQRKEHYNACHHIPFDSTIPDHRPVLLGSTKIEEEEDEVDEYWDIHIPSTPISIVPTPLSRPANFISRVAGRSARLLKGAKGLLQRMSHQQSMAVDLPPPLFHENPKGELARIARRLTGTSVGLVLGGGGARGIAHIGVIQALEEAGIPIDIVGGTSIGSFMGALYAKNPDYISMLGKAKRFCKQMASKWRKLFDLTYPRTSFFSGYEFNASIQEAIGESVQIEDLWLNYFAITTNITTSRMAVHRAGALWRYVRASMTLAGFLPPVCDSDGSLLVDGGYVNNVPADVMRALGAHTVIAVDVGAEEDTAYTNYGDWLSGWWLLWKKWAPFTENVKVPNMSDIQSHLAYVGCVQQLAEVKKQKRCLYLRPPVNDYGTLQFDRFDEILQVGYEYATKEIDKWARERAAENAPPEKKSRHRRSHSCEALLEKSGPKWL